MTRKPRPLPKPLPASLTASLTDAEVSGMTAKELVHALHNPHDNPAAYISAIATKAYVMAMEDAETLGIKSGEFVMYFAAAIMAAIGHNASGFSPAEFDDMKASMLDLVGMNLEANYNLAVDERNARNLGRKRKQR